MSVESTAAPARPAAPQPRPEPRRRARPQLRVVPRHARRRRAGLAVTALGLVLFATLFALAAFQALIARNQMQLDRTQERLAAAQAYHDKLRLQVARQESPDNVIARAVGELGMVPPDQISYVSPSLAQAREAGSASAGAPPLAPGATPVVTLPSDAGQLPG